MRTQTMRMAVLFGMVALCTRTSHAQLSSPGPSGVVMGHVHLNTTDMQASQRFWTAMGGVPVQNGQLQLIQFPGTFIMLRQSTRILGPSEGSSVERVVFRVRTAELLPLVQRLGLATRSNYAPGLITSPEGVTIELRGAESQEPAIRMERLLFQTGAPAETRDWYVKTFGATPDSTGATPLALLPDLAMYFTRADTTAAATRGRALDHIGFEVKNLEAFCKKLEAEGHKFDRPYGRLPNSTTGIAFLTDPWGTYIELTENLAPPK